MSRSGAGACLCAPLPASVLLFFRTHGRPMFSRIALFLTAAIALTICWQAATTGQLNHDSPESFRPVEFEWRTDDNDSDDPDFLIITYDDGRIVSLRVAAITIAKFYPRKIAVAMTGIDAANIQITVGGQRLRVDLPTDADAQALYREFFPANDGTRKLRFDNEQGNNQRSLRNHPTSFMGWSIP